MKRWGCLLVAVAALGFLVETVAAQPEGAPRQGGRRRQDRDESRRGRRGRRPPAPPLMVALDKDKDGEISAAEIENAVAALKTLDKNKDGKLSRDEIGPPEGFGDRRFGGRRGRRGGREFGGRGGPRGDFIARIMANDKNKDGKVSKDEVPERMKEFFGRLDSNDDGFIEKKELEEAQRRFRGGRQGRGNNENRPKKKRRPDSDQ